MRLSRVLNEISKRAVQNDISKRAVQAKKLFGLIFISCLDAKWIHERMICNTQDIYKLEEK